MTLLIIILVVVVLVAVVASAVFVRVKHRRGGVIVGAEKPRGGTRP
jgi:hypothetical protein